MSPRDRALDAVDLMRMLNEPDGAAPAEAHGASPRGSVQTPSTSQREERPSTTDQTAGGEQENPCSLPRDISVSSPPSSALHGLNYLSFC